MVIDTQHHDSHNKTVFEGKRSQDLCENVPTLTGFHLATHPKSGSCGSSESVCWYSVCLSWKPLNAHFVFAFKEVTLFARLDSKHPSSGYIIPRFALPQINKIENFIINPGFVSPKCFASALCNILLLLWLRLPLVHEISFSFLFLLPFRRSSYILPTHLEFDRQLLLELQLVCYWSYWSSHWGTMIVVHKA